MLTFHPHQLSKRLQLIIFFRGLTCRKPLCRLSANKRSPGPGTDPCHNQAYACRPPPIAGGGRRHFLTLVLDNDQRPAAALLILTGLLPMFADRLLTPAIIQRWLTCEQTHTAKMYAVCSMQYALCTCTQLPDDAIEHQQCLPGGCPHPPDQRGNKGRADSGHTPSVHCEYDTHMPHPVCHH